LPVSTWPVSTPPTVVSRVSVPSQSLIGLPFGEVVVC
jgi:hypothetical protein